MRVRALIRAPAIAFDADVLSWSLGAPPPAGPARHHIKGASFLGTDRLSLELVLPADHGPLRIAHVGVRERAMWPARASDAAKGLGGRALEVLARIDDWVAQKYEGRVDAMILGCVGGVSVVE
jgi:hypothetical protein